MRLLKTTWPDGPVAISPFLEQRTLFALAILPHLFEASVGMGRAIMTASATAHVVQIRLKMIPNAVGPQRSQRLHVLIKPQELIAGAPNFFVFYGQLFQDDCVKTHPPATALEVPDSINFILFRSFELRWRKVGCISFILRFIWQELIKRCELV